jgi:hypothetical protein
MSYRSFHTSALIALVVLATACGSKKPPEHPEGEEDTTEETTAEKNTPPPPPKCEKLEEKCAAKKDATAEIKNANVAFKPTDGWFYAQGADETIIQAPDDSATFVATSYATDKDAKKDLANREAALASVVKSANATMPKGFKVNWKKPDDNRAPNGLKLELWQVPGAERNKKKGILLVVHGPLPEGRALIGVGFAADGDEKAPEAIMGSIESMKPGKAGDKKADDKKADDKKADDKKLKNPFEEK